MNVMEKILKGELVPDVEYKIANPDYEKSFTEAGETYESLLDELPKEQAERVEKMYDAMVDEMGILSKEYFKLGMSIGIKMMKEADEYLEKWAKGKEE